MSDAFDDRRKAKEEEFFMRQNQEALKKLGARKDGGDEQPVRISPITGEPMVQKEINGVIVDVCLKSGGIWLDAGELEQIIEKSEADNSWFKSFFSIINKK